MSLIRCAAIVLAVFALGIPATVHADRLEEAEAAYDAATEAHQRNDYELAARLFARADELAPNSVALETALREAILADLPGLAMELVARSRRETAPPPGLLEAVKIAEEKYAARVGTIEVRCGGCRATLDGTEVLVGSTSIVTVGSHRVELMPPNGPSETRDIDVVAGAAIVIEPRPPPVVKPPPLVPTVEPSTEGIHPAWITIGLVATAAFGAASIASYVDALAIERDLELLRASGESEGAAELAERGKGAEIRLYVFEGLTGASALATVLVAALAIDWNGTESGRASLAPRVGLGLASVQLAWAF